MNGAQKACYVCTTKGVLLSLLHKMIFPYYVEMKRKTRARMRWKMHSMHMAS